MFRGDFHGYKVKTIASQLCHVSRKENTYIANYTGKFSWMTIKIMKITI